MVVSKANYFILSENTEWSWLIHHGISLEIEILLSLISYQMDYACETLIRTKFQPTNHKLNTGLIRASLRSLTSLSKPTGEIHYLYIRNMYYREIHWYVTRSDQINLQQAPLGDWLSPNFEIRVLKMISVERLTAHPSLSCKVPVHIVHVS